MLASSTIVTHIVFGLHNASHKLRTLASELLAALCVLSLTEGHKLVLAGFSDYRVAYGEDFRFVELVESLQVGSTPRMDEKSPPNLDTSEGIWEARSATLALINAIVNCPEALEDRVMLRDELTRRGLNEAIVVSIRLPLRPKRYVIEFLQRWFRR